MDVTVTNGRDILEKLFSKTKHSPPKDQFIDKSTTQIPDLSLDSAATTFPEPSFIKPMSMRMLARDEVQLSTRLNRRANSLPGRDIDCTPGHSTHLRQRSLGSISHRPRPSFATRSSSCRQGRQTDASVAELINSFQFPLNRLHGRISNSLTPPVSPGGLKEPFQLAPDSQAPLRMDTPPPSDHDDSPSVKSARRQKRPLCRTPPDELTPVPSPVLPPTIKKGSEGIDAKPPSTSKRTCNRSLSGSPSSRTAATHRKVVSDSQFALRATGSDRRVLHEPTLGDFMSLSDDDVAEEVAAELRCVQRPKILATAPSPPLDEKLPLPPNPPYHMTQSLKEGFGQLDAASSSATNCPETVAAFETARLAARYGFDLVYVVNIWPSCLTSCSLQAPMFYHSSTTMTPVSTVDSLRSARALEKGMQAHGCVACISGGSDIAGRLLAAYGLQAIASPFRISAPVHEKILRSTGWIEYRNKKAAADEFAQGYGRSFYTGHCVAMRDASTNLDGTPPAPNHGVVFAAYRLPRPERAALKPGDLRDLHEEAENLVETLIDIQIGQRP